MSAKPEPFERPVERKALRFHLEKRRSILMLAPRRIGKTWLLNRLADDLRDGWAVIQCNVEGMSTEEEFLEHVCSQIEAAADTKGKALGRLRQVLDNLTKADLSEGWQKALRTDWRAFATVLVRRLDEQDHDTVILVDEIALFVATLQRHDQQRARNFLYQLRNLRQAHPKVRWVFTGSVGLDTIARRGEVSGALVDLQLFPLEPFDAPAARAYLDHLSATAEIQRPFSLEDAVFDHLATELGWLSPYYILQIAQQVRASGPPGPGHHPTASRDDLDAAFNTLLAPAYRTYFAAWEEHLSKNFPPDEATQLHLILVACATQAEGELLDTLLATLSRPPHNLTRRALRDRLTVLVNDGYLSETGDEERPRFRFRSGLLRRYWLKYHAE